MFIRIFFVIFLAMPGIAQVISSVRGAVASDELLTGNHLVVSLTDAVTRKTVDRAFVAGDGTFEFRNVPPGAYMVELAVSSGDPILTQAVSLNTSGDRIDLRLPERENKAGGPAATVSVRELKHPLSAKAKRIFAAAQKASAKGEYLNAIDLLRGVVNEPAAEPFARMNIGVAYVRAGQPAPAVPELRDAVRLMPDDPVAHTNFAYALLLTRRVDEAEEEARHALRLDKNNSKARWVMGSVLLTKGSRVEEAVEDLRLASREIPRARVQLAQFYERTGQRAEAVRELREFLPQASEQDRATVERWLSKLDVEALGKVK